MLSRLGHPETGAELDRESAATTFQSQSSGKREHLEKILERKVDLAIHGEKGAQHKLYH